VGTRSPSANIRLAYLWSSGLPECRRRYQREGCESGDPGVMQISSFCIDFGLGFGVRYAKYAMYFKGRDEF
jgi:hypothetical protein